MNSRERGSAVVTVVLVVLVLTMVGVAALIFMSLEQNLTLADRLAKETLYICEAGMRQGEAAIRGNSGSMGINALLNYASPHSIIPSDMEECSDSEHLGAILFNPDTGTAYYQVTPTFYTPPGGYYAVFSLYVRNNPDDPSHSPYLDNDSRLKVVCVGEVYMGGPPTDPNARLVGRKVAEEMMGTGLIMSSSDQKGGSSAGTGSTYM